MTKEALGFGESERLDGLSGEDEEEVIVSEEGEDLRGSSLECGKIGDLALVAAIEFDKLHDRSEAKNNMFIVFSPLDMLDRVRETRYLDYFTGFAARLYFPFTGKDDTDFSVTSKEEFFAIVGELNTLYTASHFFDYTFPLDKVWVNDEKPSFATFLEESECVLIVDGE